MRGRQSFLAPFEGLVHKTVLSLFHVKGVTLTDLQEAEKTMKTMKMDNKGREKKEEEEKEKEKEAKPKKGEEGVRAIFLSYSPVLAALI